MSECSFTDTASEVSDCTPSSSCASVYVQKVISSSMQHLDDPALNELLTRKQPKFIPQAPKCARCAQSVYKAEEVRAANKTFHKFCFKCSACSKLLETNTLTEHQGEQYCKNCYAKNFGPKGYGFGAGAGIMSSSESVQCLNTPTVYGEQSPKAPNPNEVFKSVTNSAPLKCTYSSFQISDISPIAEPRNHRLNNMERRLSNPKPMNLFARDIERCTRCMKAVYAAEKINAAGRSYHKMCFTCLTCKKGLNQSSCCDNSDGEVFCKPCYGKQYGPKGVGFGISAGALML